MGERTAYAPGTPSWVDIGVPDTGKAIEFYGALFGWKGEIDPRPEAGGYGMFTLDGKNVAGVGPQQNPDMPPFWSVYVTVEDCDAAAAAAAANGGSIVVGSMDVFDAGRMAVLQDAVGSYPAATTWATASDIAVTAASPAHADGAVANGSVSGTVTRPAGRQAYSNAVAAINASTKQTVASVSVPASGAYTLPSLPDGSYNLRFTGGGQTTRFQGGATTATEATPIVVRAGHATGGVDIALEIESIIRGSVRLDFNNVHWKVGRVEVFAWPQNELVASANADASGNFLFGSLNSREYRLRITETSSPQPALTWAATDALQVVPMVVVPPTGGETYATVPTLRGVDCDRTPPDVQLPGAALNNASFINCLMIGANLTGASMRSANFSYASLGGVNFTGVDLTGAELRNAYVSGTNFTNATVTNTRWWTADVTSDTILSGVISGGVTGFMAHSGAFVERGGYLLGPGANLTNADLTYNPATSNAIGPVNLTNANFTNARLTNQGLGGSTLTGVNLTNTTLTGATIGGGRSGGIVGTPIGLAAPWRLAGGYLIGPGALLDGARLAGLSLVGADLRSTDLTGADLSGTDLTGATLIGATLRSVNLTGAVLTGADLRQVTSSAVSGTASQLPSPWIQFNGYLVGPTAQLYAADLRGLVARDLDLSGAQLGAANLRATSLVNVDLRGADLLQTDLSSAVLTGAKVEGARFSSGSSLPVVLSAAVSGGVTGTPTNMPSGWKIVGGFFVLPQSNLSGADLRNLDLSGGLLTSANLSNARLEGANLSAARLTGAKLDGASLATATLSGVISGGITGVPTSLPTGWRLVSGYLISGGANLAGANLTDFDLTGADLRGANLRGTNLTRANLTDASLVGADLTAARLPQATLTRADLTAATLTGVTSGGIVGVPAALPSGWRVLGGYVAGPGTDLTGANLANADVTGLDLTGATLRLVRSGGVIGAPLALPTGWRLIGGYLIGPAADLQGADLRTLDLRGSDLTDARLTGANVTATDLAGTTLLRVRSGGLLGLPVNLATTHAVRAGFIVGPNVDLTNGDLTAADLSSVDLRGAIVTGTVLTGANLTASDLSSLNLNGRNLTGANLTAAKLWSTQLDHAVLASTTMSGTDFGWCCNEANLYAVRSGGIVGTPANLPSGWRLVKGYLLGQAAILPGADLSGANLQGVYLGSADLTGTHFDGADLTGASLYATAPGATFVGATLVSARMDGGTFTNADFGGADLSMATLTNGRLQGARLGTATLTKVITGGVIGTPASLPPAWYLISQSLVGPGANLNRAPFTGVDLSGLDLTGASFDHAVLRSAKLTGATITNANFTGADVIGITTGAMTGAPSVLPYGVSVERGFFVGPYTNLTGADLTGVSLVDRDVRGANFKNASLAGVDLTRSYLADADFTGATGQPRGGATAQYFATTCPDGVVAGGVLATCVAHGFDP